MYGPVRRRVTVTCTAPGPLTAHRPPSDPWHVVHHLHGRMEWIYVPLIGAVDPRAALSYRTIGINHMMNVRGIGTISLEKIDNILMLNFTYSKHTLPALVHESARWGHGLPEEKIATRVFCSFFIFLRRQNKDKKSHISSGFNHG